MKFKKSILFSIIIMLVMSMAGFVLAGKLKIAPDQQYLLLATKKTSTMQKELDEAAGHGFRIITGSPTSGSEMALFLERIAQPPDIYQYKLLATTKTSTMQKELDIESEKGFRLLTETMIAKKGFLSVEIVVILEKTPVVDKYYKYLLLATSRTSTLQKEVTEARKEGYVISGMVSRGEHMVIMEKVMDKPQGESSPPK